MSDFHISPNFVENGKVVLKFYSLDTNPPPVENRENNMEKNQAFILVPWQLKPDLSSDKFFIKLSEVGILSKN